MPRNPLEAMNDAAFAVAVAPSNIARFGGSVEVAWLWGLLHRWFESADVTDRLVLSERESTALYGVSPARMAEIVAVATVKTRGHITCKTGPDGIVIVVSEAVRAYFQGDR